MADPIFYYDITLINGTLSEPYTAPWSIHLSANPANEALVLSESIGKLEPGLYVGYDGAWKFCIPYHAVTQAVIDGAQITVIYNSTATTDYTKSHTTTALYRNGSQIGGTVVSATIQDVFGVIAANNSADAVYEVNNKFPDSTGAVTIEIADIPGLPPEIASFVKTVNGVGVDSNHNVNVYLRTLPDVNVSPGSAIDGYLLRYQNTTNQWTAENPDALGFVKTIDGQSVDGSGNVVILATPAETISSTSLSLLNDSGSTTGNIKVKNLVAGNGVLLTDNGTNVNIAVPNYVRAVQSTAVGGTTLVANDGSVTQIAQVKELVAGLNVQFSTDGSSVTINATNNTAGGGTLTAVQSTGTGTSLVNYDGSGASSIALVKSIQAGSNITITQDASSQTLTIATTSAGVTSVNGLTGAVVLTASNITGFATVAYTGNYSDLIGTPAPYSLPIASSATLGGIKVGSNLTITGDGTLSATGQPLQPATITTLGGIIVGANLTVQSDGTLSANATPYTLPAATTSTLGGIIVGSTLSVQLNGTLDYNLPKATSSSLGGVKVGTGLSVAGDGTISAAKATSTTIGSIIVPTSGGLLVDVNGNISIDTTKLVTAVNSKQGSVSITAGGGISIDNSGSSIVISAPGAAGGTVTQVALAMPSIFSVSGSPVTTTGTLTASFLGQNANVVFAGPSSGSANVPTFRSLVSADLPLATGGVSGQVGAVKPGYGLTVAGDGTLTADGSKLVFSWNGRTGDVSLTAADVSGVGAPILNQHNIYTGINDFTGGTIDVTTQLTADSSNLAASTAFVHNAIASITTGVTSFNTRTGAVTLTSGDVTGVGGALLASPAFTGTPTAPTPSTADNSTKIATTAYVQNNLSGLAPIASPTFTGVPAAPTATAGTNTTQLATTAFVQNALSTLGGVTSFNGRAGVVTLSSADITGAGGALLASPAFTGTPTAPTPTVADNSTNIATTAFVQTALTSAAVISFNTRVGAVTLQASDVTGVGGALLASPTFTGSPRAPTATTGDNSTLIATTAFVQATVTAVSLQPATTTTLGGIKVGSGLSILSDGTLSTNVTSVAGRTGAVTLSVSDVSGAAPLASPAFTGTPTAPTPTVADNSTNLATTAFVQSTLLSETSITLAGSNVSLTTGNKQLYRVIILNGTLTANVIITVPAPGNWTFYNNTSGAFTVTLSNGAGATYVLQQTGSIQVFSDSSIGVWPSTSTAITQVSTDNSTNLATTAYVHNLLGTGTAVVNSFNGRSGTVTLTTADITGVGGAIVNAANTWTAVNDFTGGTLKVSTATAGDGSAASVTHLAASTQYVENARLSTTAISLGGSNVTLTPAQYGTTLIEFQGTLSASVTVTLPPSGQWIFYNNTSGAFNVTLSNGSGATYNVPQNQSAQAISVGSLGIVNGNISAFTLTPATVSTLGGVIVPNGSGLTVDSSGDLSVTPANGSTAGSVSQGAGVTITSGVISANVQTVAGVPPTSGNVPLAVGNITGAAPLASPALTGSPTAPTQAAGDNSTLIATTAYVQASLIPNPIAINTNTTLTSTQYNNFYLTFIATGTTPKAIFPTSGEWIVSNAPWASASVVLVNGGFNPNQVTVAAGQTVHVFADSTGIKLVPASTGGASGVSSFNTRTGAVTLTTADVTGVNGAIVNAANTWTAANDFTGGSITVTTQSIGDNSTKAASTAYVYNSDSATASVALAGSNVTLTAAQYSVPIIQFTGTLTASVTVTFPTTGDWTIYNTCTMAGFTITLTNGVSSSATVVISATSTVYSIISNNSTAGIITIATNASSGVTSFNTRTGAVTLQASDVTGVGGVLNSAPTISGRIQSDAATFKVQQVASGSGTVALDTSAFSEFVVTVTGSITFNLTNPPAANYGEVVILRITNGGSAAISWQASGGSITPKYASGTAPTYTASGTDVIAVLIDYVGSTTTYTVVVIAQNVS